MRLSHSSNFVRNSPYDDVVTNMLASIRLFLSSIACTVHTFFVYCLFFDFYGSACDIIFMHNFPIDYEYVVYFPFLSDNM